MRNPFVWIAAAVILAVAVALVTWQGVGPGARSTHIAGGKVTTESNPTLAAAVLVAREGLPTFKKVLAEGKAGKYAVAGRFETPRGPEHLWVRVDRFEAGAFYGVLDIEPRLYTSHKKGDPIRVAEGDVVDWMYDIGEGVQGGFTLKALSGSD